MTYPNALALHEWTSPGWGLGRRWRLSDWVQDPLERALVLALAVVSTVSLWTMATGQDAAGTPASDACAFTVVQQARAFAAVMGDDRVVPLTLGEQACARP